MKSRASRSPLSEWWWTIDKALLVSLIALLVGGVLLSLAASPPVAERLNLDTYHFVKRQLFFILPALVVMIGVSFLTPRQVRRIAFYCFVAAFILLIATLFVGVEIKGSRRWIYLAGVSLQPSEFIKPAFVVLAAWLFSESAKRTDIPGNLFAILLLIFVTAPLVVQPDFGQTMLIAVVWSVLFFLAGMPWLWILLLGGLGIAGIVSAYLVLPHVSNRIDRFLQPGSGDTFQIDTAIESFVKGGWFGRGPGEGTVKRILPDSHTDFIFAVAAEEYGIVLCLVLVLLFAFIVLRGFLHALKETDPFVRLAVSGLVALFGFQSTINMAVNLHLMPAKGMTLPFVSYGGSSLIAVALGTGFVLALTRRRVGSKVQITPLTPSGPYSSQAATSM